MIFDPNEYFISNISFALMKSEKVNGMTSVGEKMHFIGQLVYDRRGAIIIHKNCCKYQRLKLHFK